MREPPALACPVCGRPILQRASRAPWGMVQQRYCSALCRQRAKQARQTAARVARAAGAMEAG